MKINREELLNKLNAVKAGLSPREFIEQSSCFVFSEGRVYTFNDEVACRIKCDLGITGAVQAATLLAILEKIDDPDLEVVENEKGELEFQAKRKRFGVTRDAEIFLPVEKVEFPTKEDWKPLAKEFTEGISLVQHCVSTDESRFIFCCVHLHPKFIEACDNLQLMRCEVETGLTESVLVRGTSLVHITSLGMDKIALTKSWIHFKNQQGLVYSCRRYTEDYPDLQPFIDFDGKAIVIPRGLADAADRAAIFATDKAGDALVNVKVKDGKIRIRGEGLSGWFTEAKGVTYDGPAMEFVIAPELLKHICEKYPDAQITNEKLKVIGGGWTYVTTLGQKSEEKDEEVAEEEPKKKKSKAAKDEG